MRGSAAAGAVPRAVAATAGLAVAFLAIPLLGLLVATPWARLPELIASPPSLMALRLSLVTSLSATALCLLLGIPLALVLARLDGWRGRALRVLITLPLVFPPVVAGIALLSALGRRGLLGRWLYDTAGIQIPFSTLGVIIAEAFVALPFLVIALEGAVRALDRRVEEAALLLGARRWVILRRVTLPLVAPALIAGVVLCWARALGEFGATITFAGSFPGVTQTLPLAVYGLLETDREAALAMSVLLLAVSVVILLLLRQRSARVLA